MVERALRTRLRRSDGAAPGFGTLGSVGSRRIGLGVGGGVQLSVGIKASLGFLWSTVKSDHCPSTGSGV